MDCRAATGRVANRAELSGGADRDRTDDLRLAKPALSQLSYSPIEAATRAAEAAKAPPARLVSAIVGQGRVELPTSRLSGVRSNHLSYWPGQVSLAGARPVPFSFLGGGRAGFLPLPGCRGTDPSTPGN